MKSSNNKVPKRAGGGLAAAPGFYHIQPEGIGRYDWNADLYSEKQQNFLNDLEDLFIGVEMWATKNRYDVRDAHVVRTDGGEDRFIGSCLAQPGYPVIGTAELKYRTCYSTS